MNTISLEYLNIAYPTVWHYLVSIIILLYKIVFNIEFIDNRDVHIIYIHDY
jgi:hypothetical protein